MGSIVVANLVSIYAASGPSNYRADTNWETISAEYETIHGRNPQICATYPLPPAKLLGHVEQGCPMDQMPCTSKNSGARLFGKFGLQISMNAEDFSVVFYRTNG